MSAQKVYFSDWPVKWGSFVVELNFQLKSLEVPFLRAVEFYGYILKIDRGFFLRNPFGRE